jgi:hypothetical protein
MKATNTVATRLPVWALTLIALIIVVYIGVLGGVAIWSERDVKFWPPEIGKGPKSMLISELKEARSDLQRIKLGAESEISVLNTRLNDARTNQSKTRDGKIFESMEWEDQAKAIEKDILRYEEKIIKKIDIFNSYIRDLEGELKGL